MPENCDETYCDEHGRPHPNRYATVGGRVLTNEEVEAIVAEPWTAHLHNYEDIARTLDVMRNTRRCNECYGWVGMDESLPELTDSGCICPRKGEIGTVGGREVRPLTDRLRADPLALGTDGQPYLDHHDCYSLRRQAADRIEELESEREHDMKVMTRLGDCVQALEAALLRTAQGYHNEHPHTLGESFTDCMWSLCYEYRKTRHSVRHL